MTEAGRNHHDAGSPPVHGRTVSDRDFEDLRTAQSVFSNADRHRAHSSTDRFVADAEMVAVAAVDGSYFATLGWREHPPRE